MSILPRFALFVALAAGATACKKEEATDKPATTTATKTPDARAAAGAAGVDAAPAATTTTTTADGGGGDTAAATTVDDAQIVGIVTVANQGEIDHGKLAKTKTKTKEVVELADMMIKEHTAMQDEGSKLAAKAKLSPAESDLSKQLKADADAAAKELGALEGAAFDKAYVAGQVEMHRVVLETVDDVLIPNAKSPELKAMLEKARPKIAAHLEHAEKLAGTLK